MGNANEGRIYPPLLADFCFMVVDYSLYLVTDAKAAKNRSIPKIVDAAIRGGVTVVQYREKSLSKEEMVRQVKEIHKVTSIYGVPLIINDYVDVALEAGAEGIHVGQGDMPADKVRKLIGPKRILGVSVKTKKEAQKAFEDGADYLGVGSIFETKTKTDAKPVSKYQLEEIVTAVNIPLVGIGGITIDNAHMVIESGLTGIAVISAIFNSSDPNAAARKLKKAIKSISCEFNLIDSITQKIPNHSRSLIRGAGDDAAVVKITKDRYLLATCDSQVSGVHFLPDIAKPEEIGRKAIGVNVSDIAAMGGKPTFCLVSLILPPILKKDYIDRLYNGIIEEAGKYKVQIIGGNISKGQALVVDISMMGEAKLSRLLLRSNAKPGDKVCVTGSLGDAAAGLELLLNLQLSIDKKDRLLLTSKQLTPSVRLSESSVIAQTQKATAMIDISDGLGSDVIHICEQSKAGVSLYEELIPIAPLVRKIAGLMKKPVLDFSLNGGEDYELCFTVPELFVDKVTNLVRKKTGTKVTVIGEILPEREGRWLVLKNGKRVPLRASGWDHFETS